MIMMGKHDNKKEIFLNDIKDGENITISLMVQKVIFRDNCKIACVLSDKSGDIKADIPNKNDDISEGTVIKVECVKNRILNVEEYELISDYEISDYLPTVDRPIEEIMNDIEFYTDKYIVSTQAKALNDYFFKDVVFLDKFKRGIGGVSMHHSYIGGLAEHTLNVMYLTIMLCERYNCRRTEIAVLSAKLHDIGKIYELYYDGPFRYTLRGEMEGHIVIGTELIDEAIKENPEIYSEDFVTRVKGCVVQHHGKLEYGSPRETNMEESFILNYADSIDASMNKIAQMKAKTESGSWSAFDKKIGTRLYL